MLQKLRPWAAARPGVIVVEGTWQQTLPALGTFDAIFMDDFGRYAARMSEEELNQLLQSGDKEIWSKVKKMQLDELDELYAQGLSGLKK